MWKQYQNGLNGVENDHTGLSLVSMESLINPYPPTAQLNSVASFTTV